MQEEKIVKKGHGVKKTEKSSEIDVYKVNLPFFRVFPISWIDYQANSRLLTVSRTNSTVELWSYPYWHLVTKIYFQRAVSIRKAFLVLKEGSPTYLVAVTTNSYIITYDLKNGVFTQHLLHGGDFAFDWDFVQLNDGIISEQPLPEHNDKQQNFLDEESDDNEDLKNYTKTDRRNEYVNEETLGHLIISCNDGACRYYELSPSGNFVLLATTQAKKEKATSCSFAKNWPLGENQSKLSNAFTVGYDNGDIRIFSERGKKLELTITGEKSKGIKNSIWSIALVQPHFIIAGHSDGKIKIYETNYGTEIKEFREHVGDILALTVSRDGNRIFASGADSQIILIQKSSENIEGVELVNFTMTSKDRGQSHDIYSIVELHKDLIISGGLSTDICLYKISESRFQERNLSKNRKVKLRHIT